MRPNRIILLLALCMLAACGASQRTRAIKATLAATNTARDGFLAFDGTAQLAIVEKATTREEGAARLTAYREKRNEITNSFALAYQAIATAAVANDDPSVAAMLDAAKKLYAAVDAARREFQ